VYYLVHRKDNEKEISHIEEEIPSQPQSADNQQRLSAAESERDQRLKHSAEIFWRESRRGYLPAWRLLSRFRASGRHF